jgi:hypothetical protein
VEYLASPAIMTALVCGHLPGMQFMYPVESQGSSSSSLFEIPKKHNEDRHMIVQDLLFQRCRLIYVGLLNELSKPL